MEEGSEEEKSTAEKLRGLSKEAVSDTIDVARKMVKEGEV